jgi:tRNA A58 N-methylase Trm61
MSAKYNVLYLGASYGSLLAAKAALAGHSGHLICLPEEASLINSEGAVVRLPVRGVEGLVELNTKKMPGKVTAGAPEKANLADFDLVVLAMQEPQYRVPVVKELLNRVAASRKPCM